MGFEEDVRTFARILATEIKYDFLNCHYTGNLMNTMKITYNEVEGKTTIEIPAQTYNFLTYQRTGAIVPKNDGKSYADEVDIHGGFSQKHKSYVDRAINRTIPNWKSMCNIKTIRSAQENENK